MNNCTRCCKNCNFYSERMTCLLNEEEITEAIAETMTNDEYERFVSRKHNDVCTRFREKEEN